jgi:hypothetical protein
LTVTAEMLAAASANIAIAAGNDRIYGDALPLKFAGDDDARCFMAQNFRWWLGGIVTEVDVHVRATDAADVDFHDDVLVGLRIGLVPEDERLGAGIDQRLHRRASGQAGAPLLLLAGAPTQ